METKSIIQPAMINIGYIDNQFTQFKNIKSILAEHGYNSRRILTSKKLEDAKDWLKLSKIHVLISDYRMKPVNGLIFLCECRSEFRDFPLILLSGEAGFNIRNHAMLQDHDIEALDKVDMNTLPSMLYSMVETEYKDEEIFQLISDKIIPEKSEPKSAIIDNSKRLDKSISNSVKRFLLFKSNEDSVMSEENLISLMLEDFNRISVSSEGKAHMRINDQINLNINDAIAEVVKESKVGQAIIKFWIRGYKKLKSGNVR